MASPKAAAPIRPLLSVGRYEIYERIASGGMAAVHVGMLLVGQASGMARPVAIKRLHPHLAEDPEFVAMFLDEAKLAARLSHPNIVPTLDVITQGREVFLVMEYVAGESLATVLRILNERKQLPPVEIIAAVVTDALQGLGAAHRATNELGKPLGIVHRDISPQNVIVGADGHSRLLDFGIAKAADRAQFTREGQIRGKIAYLAPEQLRGTPASPRTDLFSMGVVLWESLTARRLFHASSDARLVSKVLECQVSAPSEHNPRVPPALDALLARALHRNPEARFQSADEMLGALEQAARPTLRRDVGAWLQGLSGDSLDRRALQIQAFERSSAQRRASQGDRPVPSPAPQQPGARAAPSSGTVPTMLSPGPPSPSPVARPPASPGPVARPPVSPVSFAAPNAAPASPPVRALPNLPALPGQGPQQPYPPQPAYPHQQPYPPPQASPPQQPYSPRQPYPPQQPRLDPGAPVPHVPAAPEARVSPMSLLVSEGRALVMPPRAWGQPTAQAPPGAPAFAGAGPPPLPAPTAAATGHAKPALLPSRRYGGLVLVAGIVLGGLLTRAFVLWREAHPPAGGPDVVEPGSTSSPPVLSPNDLPPANPSAAPRGTAPGPAGSVPRPPSRRNAG